MYCPKGCIIVSTSLWLHRYDRIEIHRLSSRKRNKLLFRKLFNIGKSRSADTVDHRLDNFQACRMRVVPGFGTVDFTTPVMRALAASVSAKRPDWVAITASSAFAKSNSSLFDTPLSGIPPRVESDEKSLLRG